MENGERICKVGSSAELEKWNLEKVWSVQMKLGQLFTTGSFQSLDSALPQRLRDDGPILSELHGSQVLEWDTSEYVFTVVNSF